MAQHRLYGFRNEAFGLEKERIYEQDREAIAKYFWEIHNRNGKFTPRDFGAIAVKFQLPLTVMNDFLNKVTNTKFPVNVWENLKDCGYKARDIGVIWK